VNQGLQFDTSSLWFSANRTSFASASCPARPLPSDPRGNVAPPADLRFDFLRQIDCRTQRKSVSPARSHGSRIASKCQSPDKPGVRFPLLNAPKRALHDWVAPRASCRPLRVPPNLARGEFGCVARRFFGPPVDASSSLLRLLTHLTLALSDRNV